MSNAIGLRGRTRVKLIKKGFDQIAASPEMMEALWNAAGDRMAAVGMDSRYKRQRWYERKRAVVNVVDKSPQALNREAKTGKFNRFANSSSARVATTYKSRGRRASVQRARDEKTGKFTKKKAV